MFQYSSLTGVLIILQLSILANCYYCDSRCKSCTASSRCTSCLQGWTLYQSSCFKCPQRCKTCISDSKCVYFYDGYYLYQKNCYACSKGCKICQNPPSYYKYLNFNISYENCAACQPGYFLSNKSICLSCSENCLSCRSISKCSYCANGTYLSQDFCLSCSPNCISCSLPTKCRNCSANYSLINGLCEFTNHSNNIVTTKNSNLTTIIVAVAATTVGVASVVVIIIWCYLKKKREAEQQLKRQNEAISSLQPIIVKSKQRWQSHPAINSDLCKQVCSICLELQPNVLTDCKHAYHDKCLFFWCKKIGLFPTCPNCRCRLDDIRLICKMCHQKYKQIKWNGLGQTRNLSRFVNKCCSCKSQNPQK